MPEAQYVRGVAERRTDLVARGEGKILRLPFEVQESVRRGTTPPFRTTRRAHACTSARRPGSTPSAVAADAPRARRLFLRPRADVLAVHLRDHTHRVLLPARGFAPVLVRAGAHVLRLH